MELGCALGSLIAGLIGVATDLPGVLSFLADSGTPLNADRGAILQQGFMRMAKTETKRCLYPLSSWWVQDQSLDHQDTCVLKSRHGLKGIHVTVYLKGARWSGSDWTMLALEAELLIVKINNGLLNLCNSHSLNEVQHKGSPVKLRSHESTDPAYSPWNSQPFPIYLTIFSNMTLSMLLARPGFISLGTELQPLSTFDVGRQSHFWSAKLTLILRSFRLACLAYSSKASACSSVTSWLYSLRCEIAHIQQWQESKEKYYSMLSLPVWALLIATTYSSQSVKTKSVKIDSLRPLQSCRHEHQVCYWQYAPSQCLSCVWLL